jgi:hypothetical protein
MVNLGSPNINLCLRYFCIEVVRLVSKGQPNLFNKFEIFYYNFFLIIHFSSLWVDYLMLEIKVKSYMQMDFMLLFFGQCMMQWSIPI